ncbi:hypothetical protein [Tissierella praeacuta]|uniref:hypothetical protein n=1 Tax=Tissierella praeacuta TaxID=43131 RepID=UPI003341BB05
MYKPTEWKNKVYDEQGNLLRDGTPLHAEYFNNIENGIVEAHEEKHSHENKDVLDNISDEDIERIYIHDKELLNLTHRINNLKTKKVKDILERNSLENKDSIVHVIDATGDNTVTKGWAEYIYYNDKWIKTAEEESLDRIINWEEIINKPSTFTPSEHDHDALYYKKVDIDNKLKEKSNTNHTHEDKADKTYVEKELNKKYDKDEVFNKEEVLQKIQDLIGAAPEALDTLAELAKALGEDPNFATNILNQLEKKVDKVAGKGLSTEDFTIDRKDKLDEIEEGANNYIHPKTHSANIIVENENKRFVSDAAIANWDDANSKKHAHINKSILDIITQTLINSWNNAVEHTLDSARHVTQKDKDKWDKVDNKADKVYVDDTFATKEEISIAGYGDMMKSVYDKNNDGIIDIAERANKLKIVDTRSIDSPPSYYFGQNMFWEFKSRKSVGNPPADASASSAYAFILTITGWMDSSGGYPVQLSVGGKNIAIRQGTSTSAWGSWNVIANTGDLPTKLSELVKDIDFDERYYTKIEVDEKLSGKASTGHTHSQLHTHNNKNILDKLADLGGHSSIDLDLIYTHKHSYNDLQNRPSIPSKTSDLQNDSSFVSGNMSKITVSSAAPTNPKQNDIWIVI